MQNAQQIIQQLEAAGFKAAFLPMRAMEQVKEHYDSLERRAPESDWIKGAVEKFRGNQTPKLEFEPKSFLVAAVPCKGATLALQRKGKRIEIPVAPAYIGISPQKRRLREILAETGCQLEDAWLVSQKLLAALSGLGQYGRNNICYVGEWGSYAWLESWYTDIPFEGPVQADLRMEACEGCERCRGACPTGAIGDTQVIDAARCLAMKNERGGRMPRWVPRGAHHTLAGCLRCQECCPQNPAIDFSRTLALDARETRRLLSRGKKLPQDLEGKLKEFGCEKWTMRVIKRNARLAVKAKGV